MARRCKELERKVEALRGHQICTSFDVRLSPASNARDSLTGVYKQDDPLPRHCPMHRTSQLSTNVAESSALTSASFSLRRNHPRQRREGDSLPQAMPFHPLIRTQHLSESSLHLHSRRPRPPGWGHEEDGGTEDTCKFTVDQHPFSFVQPGRTACPTSQACPWERQSNPSPPSSGCHSYLSCIRSDGGNLNCTAVDHDWYRPLPHPYATRK